jgi:hypothetical protein
VKNEKPTPAFEARLNHIRVSVWANSNNGKAWFNTVVTRRYRDGDEWKDSNSFSGLGDLALAAEGVRLAQDFIREQKLTNGSANADDAEA